MARPFVCFISSFDFLCLLPNTPEAVAADLSAPEVVGLRLYTGPPRGATATYQRCGAVAPDFPYS